jgi:hypothetical protein
LLALVLVGVLQELGADVTLLQAFHGLIRRACVSH